MRRAIWAGGALLALGLTACETETPFQQSGGPVYDFLVVIEAASAGRLPGDSVRLFVRGTIIDSARVTLKGLPALSSGGYTVYAVDERVTPVTTTTAAADLVPDSLGRTRVTFTGSALTGATAVVVGFGGADYATSFKPLFFRFRNLTTGALTTAGVFKLGKFLENVDSSTAFRLPPATKWGRGGLWIDQPVEGDIWLRGYVQHLPLAPNGFQWKAWAVQVTATGDTLRAAAPMDLLEDESGAAITDAETAPEGALLKEFPKAFFDGTKSALTPELDRYTHVFITLEPRGAPGTLPAPAVVYRGSFPRQFTLRAAALP
ncbi:MAG: hypothetical protein HY561_12720 [Gemmatimonadetes bacterium]|nr:hypothetical protein [Gemmatimonadota bacterium]